ncbi:Aldehyde/histidinol dehydrogenase [Ilyonectria destructans]|nr:Aldehyde/histidinol dehydrogenase [Ilyonectria destructans]
MATETKRPVETKLFINGEFVDASDKKTFPLKSPWTHEVVAYVAEATIDDTNAAVSAAKAAQPAWAKLSPKQRGQHLRLFAGLLREHGEELARLEAVSMGRPVSGYADHLIAANRFEYYAEAGYTVQGQSSLNTPGQLNVTLRQPFGVVAAIIPWNVPLVAFSGKVGPALAAGNTVILKSSEKAPLTSSKVAEYINQAGFPPGVVNILSGHGHISGAALASHMDVRALSFTGSTRTGRLIQEAAAKSNMKNLIFELGGKSPAVVFEDADLEKAVPATAHSIQWNSGQVCMANSRVYVQRSIAPAFIEAFKESFGRVHLGDPTDPATNHGPLADAAQADIVTRYLEMGKQSGQLILGGDFEPNTFTVKPTIFTDTTEDSKILKEEVFGPVVHINTFDTEMEALEKANASEYGLYAAVYTRDFGRALRFAIGLESGTVGVNCTSPVTGFDMPFGGYKGSGIGREGIRESLDSFLEKKSVLLMLN